MIKNTSMGIRLTLAAILLLASSAVRAQIGSHRSDFAVGINGGYIMSSVSFNPDVPQQQHTGMTGGLSFRYVCEKYFSTICSIYGEVNYAQIGWKEKIWDINDQPVINPATGVAEKYSRTVNYVQIPVFAHLAWGRERKGLQFFFQAGPQLGIYLSDKTTKNFDLDSRNTTDRVSSVVAQDTMSVENKIDYGIAAGLGVEYSIPKFGHILLEGRYYYGLGDMFGNSKKDYFGRSNFGNIVVKLSLLFDVFKTKEQ